MSTNNNEVKGGFVKPLLIGLVLVALAFFGYKSCSGGEDHDHDDHAKTEEIKADDHKVDNSLGDLEDHDDHAGHDHADEQTTADTDAAPAEMDTKGLNFEQGTWEWNMYDFLANGSGSKSFVLDKIPFEGEEVSAEGKEQLDNLAAMLKAYPELKAEIQGHTTKAKNALGEKKKVVTTKARALWVHAKLKLRGVSGDQLVSKGLGDKELLTSVGEEDAAQKRIVIKFNK